MGESSRIKSVNRNTRVQLIKRAIIITLIVIIILPLILCIYLFCKVNMLEDQVQELYKISEKQKFVMSMKEEPEEVKDTVQDENSHADINANQTAFEQDLSKMTLLEETVLLDEASWPNKVYLTFDDGPSYLTDDILDILAQYDVKASFFVIGTDNPDLKAVYKRIVDEGHTLGMHSYSHKYQEIYASQEAFAGDLNKLENLLYEETGIIPKIYRFPGGSSNTVSPISMGFFIDYLEAKDLTYYDWNISAGDAAGKLLTKEEIVKNALYGIEENEETMILMHDIGDKATTVEALPEIIEALQKRNIPIVKIDEDTIPIQHISE